MLGVVADAEVALDEAGDPRGGPELVLPAVCLGPLGQERLRAAQVGVGEARGGAGLGPGVQAAGPAGEGLGVDAEHPRDGRAGLPFGDGLDGPPAAAPQLGGGTDWSTHTRLDARRPQREH